MANPGIPSSQLPPGEDWIPRALKDLQRDIREALPSVARSFKPVVDRLDAADAAMAANVAAIAANVASINDLLTRVVGPGVIYGTASNFAITTTDTVFKTITVAVPTGYTTAQITATGRVGVYNQNTTGGSNGAGGDYVHVQTVIGAYAGMGLAETVLGINTSAINSATFSTTLIGLVAGNTFNVSVKAHTDYQTLAASTNNVAEVSGSVLFLR